MTPQEIIDAYKAEKERIWKEAYAEAYAEGRAQAYAEGRAQARAEGRAQAYAETLLKVYTHRFGPPPADVSERVGQVLDPALLNEWLDLAAFGAADDLPRAVRALPAT